MRTTQTPDIAVAARRAGGTTVYVVFRSETGQELATAPTRTMAELIQQTCLELLASGDATGWGEGHLLLRGTAA